jgi:hypothetical protein
MRLKDLKYIISEDEHHLLRDENETAEAYELKRQRYKKELNNHEK